MRVVIFMTEHSTWTAPCDFCREPAEEYVTDLTGTDVPICELCEVRIRVLVGDLGADTQRWQWYAVLTRRPAPNSSTLTEAERIIREAQRGRDKWSR